VGAVEVIVALLIAVGLVGIFIPILPGPLLIIGAIAIWASEQDTTGGWVVFGVAAAVMAVGWLIKYLIPGKNLRNAGVPTRTMLAGAVLGVIGFFVVPIIGFLIGFALGIYLAELVRLGHDQAWPSTIHAFKAVGVSILIEFCAGTLAALIWVTGVIIT
jgi:uncharacterized protein YqgC (DUF456 family)